MKTIFVFYPHCYLKSTSTEVLVFDTLNNNKYVYINDLALSVLDKESLLKGFVCVSRTLDNFINQCVCKDLGYFLNYEDTPPYMFNRNLDIVTSLHKERRALGYNLQSHTNALLKEVTILLNSDTKKYHDDLCEQMEIPKYGSFIFNFNDILNQLSSFPNLESVILSGKIEMSQLIDTLNYTKERNIHLVHRLLFQSEDSLYSSQFLEKYENFSIEFIVDNSINLLHFSKGINNKVYLKAIIQSTEDLSHFRNVENVIFMPVFSSKQPNMGMLNLMILSKHEILQSPQSIKDCLISDYINANSFGRLVIDSTGFVSCMGDKIASILENDLSSIINTWINDGECMWFYTRAKKEPCAHCALQALCPPISLQEKLGYYQCPCKIY